MKGFKKLLTGILAATMIMGASLNVAAEETTQTQPAATENVVSTKTVSANAGDYQIKLQQTNKNQTYTVYKLFDATTNSARKVATDDSTTTDVTTEGITYTLPSGKTLEGNAWFTDTNGYVRLKDGISESSLSTNEFREWAKTFGTEVVHETADNDGQEIVFTGLTEGYYFISTTTGTLATVTSVAPNALVKDKNSVPTVTKVEDQPTNDFGDVVTYTVNITLQPGSKNVVFHDRLTKGLTLANAPESIKIGTDDLSASNYELTKWTNVEEDGQDDISIKFIQDYLDTISEATVVTLTYKATVNAQAVINEHNDAWINYSENNEVTSEHVTVYESTFKFKVVKVDEHDQPLAGAKFVLSKNSELGDITENNITDKKADLLAFDADGNYTPGGDSYIQTGNNNAEFMFNGLDADPDAAIEYYLYEVTAPNGYNKLTAPIKVVITPVLKGTKVESYVLTYTVNNVATSIDGVIGQVPSFNVVNNQGTVLPSTGGIGTTIFYIIGGLLIVAAVVFFVVRRKND
ncbi:SpaH/EbpB family LPXTG-anchored major pilin [Butyrivibrio sp. WCE2006]|uniref:SpaH/EbpB family LPXTG-anchored major pilin n=1 Tax=Butyrivibrio sp. WCE2006 TaxID=1410611 RepID=UPI0005D1A57B|nr:SpaH/EbpB family LPXTG-anchored major pilin [Butyrivibrio sp. WCE2006]